VIRDLFIVAATFALTACASTSASPSNDARAVVEAKFAAVNRHDIAGIVALYAPEAEITASDFCAPRHGHADVERIYRGIFAAIPDAVADVESYVAEGDRVAVRFVVRGHFGSTAVAIPIMNFFTVENGRITRDDGIFDNGGRACSA